jgi:hypothetical protein
MPETLDVVLRGIAIGVAASALMDVWSAVLRRCFGIPTLDYRLLGRWIGHFRYGRFFHPKVAAAEPVVGERAIGWIAHYSIGVTFAFVLLAIVGLRWLEAPTIWPALAVGMATIAAPWLVMQPAMGAGIAAAKAQNPGATRIRNLGTHAVYGVGLFAAATTLAALRA